MKAGTVISVKDLKRVKSTPAERKRIRESIRYVVSTGSGDLFSLDLFNKKSIDLNIAEADSLRGDLTRWIQSRI